MDVYHSLPANEKNEKNESSLSDLMHLVTPGDIITEDTGFMRYANIQLQLSLNFFMVL